MSDESPRRRTNRKRDRNSVTVLADSVLYEFTDTVPLPGSPEYLEYQERLNRRRLERHPDSPFIVDESKKPADDQPPAE